MESENKKFKFRLGLFIAGGLAIFVVAIFLIGRQKNLFSQVFKISTTFHNVSGLQIGSNVRYSGINIGTVDNIAIVNDSTVLVDLLIDHDVKKFIKSDCRAGIGSSGVIGDRILVISQGTNKAYQIKPEQFIASDEPVETDEIMISLQVTADNAAIITDQLAEIMIKVNSGSGTLGQLIQDSTLAGNINQTIVNLKKSSKSLDENMNAAKESFFLKGYFKRKAKAAEKKKEEAAEKKAEEKKKNKK